MPNDAAHRLDSEIVVTMLLGEQPGDVDSSLVDRVISIAEYIEVPAGTTLFSEGEPHEFVYLLVKGRLRLDRRGAAPWIYARPGEVGALSLAEDRASLRTGVALTETHLVRTRIDAILDLFEETFVLGRRAINTGLGRLHSLLDALEGEAHFPEHEPRVNAPLPDGSLDLVERLLFLMDVEGLREAGVQTLVELAASTFEVRLEEGELIYPQGSPLDTAYVIAEGEVVTTRAGSAAKLVFGRGSVVNWGPGLSRSLLNWQAHATRPTRTLVFPMQDWSDAMEEHFSLLLSTLNAIGRAQERVLTLLAEPAGELVFE
jgi:CRP-like cAMP-binding protein